MSDHQGVHRKPMLLAIDSATRVLSLALHDGQQIAAEMTWSTPNRHTVELAPAIRDMMAHANVQPSMLTAVAVSQGPGSFNGLRIGFSVAKGLAMALQIPLIAIPTLDIIAAAQPPLDGILIVVIQAGRGRVCVQSYRWSESRWIGIGDLRITSWDSVLAGLSTSGAVMISGEIDTDGQAAIECCREGKRVELASPAFALRRAGFLAELAWARWRGGQIDDAASVTPLYLHQPGVPHP